MLRLLGFLFLIVLVLGGVGFCRDWFTVTAANGEEFTFSVDKEKLKSDTVAATETLGEISRQAAESIKQLARRTSAAQSVLEGAVEGVDAVARQVRVLAGVEVVTLDLGSGVELTLDGNEVGLESLTVGDQVTVDVVTDADAVRVRRIAARRD